MENRACVVFVCFMGALFASPNMFDEQLKRLSGMASQNNKSVWALTFKGGSHLLLEVEADTVFNERLTSIVDSADLALRQNAFAYTSVLDKKTKLFLFKFKTMKS